MARTDSRDLRSALHAIAVFLPAASSADFQTSDQGSYGFVLEDVTLADGTRVSQVNEDVLDHLRARVEPFVNDLSWGQVMNEDRGGSATIEVPASFDRAQLAADAYLRTLQAAVDAFNDGRCPQCGLDVDRHVFGPSNGAAKAFCTILPNED